MLVRRIEFAVFQSLVNFDDLGILSRKWQPRWHPVPQNRSEALTIAGSRRLNPPARLRICRHVSDKAAATYPGATHKLHLFQSPIYGHKWSWM